METAVSQKELRHEGPIEFVAQLAVVVASADACQQIRMG